MPKPPTALMTIVGGKTPPSLAEAASQLGLPLSDLNSAFGVISIDPERSLYAVEVRADGEPVQSGASSAYRGPYSNPRIAPFGPDEPAPAKETDPEDR